MAFKIAVSNQKGGTGKTTISVNIAAAFEAGGNKVALIDADPQGTSVRWVTSGENTLPMTVLSLALPAAASAARSRNRTRTST